MEPLPKSSQLEAMCAFVSTVPQADLDADWRQIRAMQLAGATLEQILNNSPVWQQYLESQDDCGMQHAQNPAIMGPAQA